MNCAAIYHRSSDNYCYALNKDELIINLKTGYDIEQVFIHYGDPFEGGILGGDWSWTGTRTEIGFKKKLKNHLWWTITLKPPYKRCKYYFEVKSSEKTLFYLEDGFYTQEQLDQKGSRISCFVFPWMNEIDINKTPEWVNNTIWYQIFPERFCNGNPDNDPENTKAWGSLPVSNEQFYGGDLDGIIEKLDYLKDLGINGIYLTPIFAAETAHKYDTTDYMEIDPHFGDKETFRRLITQAHNRNIRIMIDGVFNHCGRKFKPWLDVLEKGPESAYYHWFLINRWPFDPTNKDTHSGDFYSFGFTAQMPKLNTGHPDVQKYLLDVVTYWIKNYNIDGLRLDVANEISHDFCKKLRQAAKAINPDFYILGEIWNDSIHWLRGDEFDAVMNYPLSGTIQDFWTYTNSGKEDFEKAINRNYTMYMQQTNHVLFNLMDSHDTNRLMDQTKDSDIFYQQLALLFTMPGSPCIFYGTEIQLEGKHDPDCRRCMPWSEINSGIHDSKIEEIKKLTHLRKTHPAACSDHFHFTNEIDEKRVIEYIKTDDDQQQIQIFVNASCKAVSIAPKNCVLCSRKYIDHTLEPGGFLICAL